MAKMFRIFMVGLAVLVFQNTSAQDLDYFRVMQYNLMYYRQTTSFCTGSNNDANVKDAAFKKIIKYNQPDLIICNEVGSNLTVPSRILENVLNTDGVTIFKQCGYSNNGSDLVNMLFYNSEKFELKSQTAVSKTLNNANIVRLIDVYTLYYLDENLTETSDTTFIHVLAAHLKAGSNSSDETERALAAEAVMDYLETNDINGNVIIAGDFNTYSANEDCFQHFVNWPNQDFRFFDPVNAMGNWSNNSTYAFYHTQSTHSTSGGCHSGGGMDDRFDHILISEEIKDESNGIKYIANSYKALGQDGNRFNQSVIFPKNNSVPVGIDTALYVMSDHLPVQADFSVQKLPPSIGISTSKRFISNVEINRISNESFELQIETQQVDEATVVIFNAVGQKVFESAFFLSRGKNSTILNLTNFDNGLYFIHLSANHYKFETLKLLKL